MVETMGRVARVVRELSPSWGASPPTPRSAALPDETPTMTRSGSRRSAARPRARVAQSPVGDEGDAELASSSRTRTPCPARRGRRPDAPRADRPRAQQPRWPRAARLRLRFGLDDGMPDARGSGREFGSPRADPPDRGPGAAQAPHPSRSRKLASSPRKQPSGRVDSSDPRSGTDRVARRRGRFVFSPVAVALRRPLARRRSAAVATAGCGARVGVRPRDMLAMVPPRGTTGAPARPGWPEIAPCPVHHSAWLEPSQTVDCGRHLPAAWATRRRSATPWGQRAGSSRP